MSLFKEFVEGVTSGFVSIASEHQFFNSTGTPGASEVVETCCRQIGWSIDERLNANEVCLHFNDPLVRIRKVLVSVGDKGMFVGFTVFSAVRLPASRVPGDALGYLLGATSTFFRHGKCLLARTTKSLSRLAIWFPPQASIAASSRCSVKPWLKRPMNSMQRCTKPGWCDSQHRRLFHFHVTDLWKKEIDYGFRVVSVAR